MKKLLFFLPLVAMMIACGGSPKSDPSTPVGLVNYTFEMYEDGNWDELIKYFDTSDYSEGDTKAVYDIFDIRKKDIEDFGGIKSIEIIKEKISQDGNTAEFEVKVNYNDGTNETKRPYLKKVEGKWLQAM